MSPFSELFEALIFFDGEGEGEVLGNEGSGVLLDVLSRFELEMFEEVEPDLFLPDLLVALLALLVKVSISSSGKFKVGIEVDGPLSCLFGFLSLSLSIEDLDADPLLLEPEVVLEKVGAGAVKEGAEGLLPLSRGS